MGAAHDARRCMFDAWVQGIMREGQVIMREGQGIMREGAYLMRGCKGIMCEGAFMGTCVPVPVSE